MDKKLRNIFKILLALVLVLNLVGQPLVQVVAKADDENRAAKTYTIEYVDQSDNELAEETTKTTEADGKVVKSDYEKTILGYKLAKAELNGTEITEEEIELTADDNKIKAIYELDVAQTEFEYTIQHKYEDGADVKAAETKTIVKDGEVIFTELIVDDHTYVKSEVNGVEATDTKVKIDRAGIVIKNIYKKDAPVTKLKYTVKYVDDKGGQIPGKLDTRPEVNKDEEISLKDLRVNIDGYTYKETKVDNQVNTNEKLKIDKENIVIEVIYTKNPPVEKVTYTVDYLFNTSKLKNSEVKTVDKGSEIDLLALKNNTIDGYTFKEMKIDGVVTLPVNNQKIEKNSKIEYFYTKDEIKKDYTIKLVNKYDGNTIETKPVKGQVGDQVILKNLFTPTARAVSNIEALVFDEKVIFLPEDESTVIEEKAAISTSYTLTFNGVERKLDGYVGQTITLPADIGGFTTTDTSIELKEKPEDNKASYTNPNPNAPIPGVKTVSVKYLDENNKSLEDSETIRIIEGIKMDVQPKLIFGYATPLDQTLDGSKDIEFKYTRENVAYTIRIVDKDRNPILDRNGKYIENKKPDGKIGDSYTLVLSSEEKEDLKDYNYNPNVVLGRSPYIGVLASKKDTGGGGSVTERVDYKIVHEDRNGKELDVEKGRGKVGDEIKGKKNSYRDYTFYKVDPKDEKITLVSNEKKNIITYTYERDRDSGGSGSSSSGGGSYRRTSSSSSLPRLNKTDHIQYIFGYEDGTIKPEGYVTREEAAMMLYRLTDLNYSRSTVNYKGYPDVAENRWSYEAIKTLTELGVLTGYDDGTFKPTKAMTRGEVVTMVSKFEGITNSNIYRFSDTQNHWAKDYINSASENKWINGYEDGTFRPDNPVTRAEFANIINKVLERRVEADGVLPGLKTFKDLKEGKWYYYPLVEATHGHDYTRYPNGREKWSRIK